MNSDLLKMIELEMQIELRSLKIGRNGNALELRSARIIGLEMDSNSNLLKMLELEMHLNSDLSSSAFPVQCCVGSIC